MIVLVGATGRLGKVVAERLVALELLKPYFAGCSTARLRYAELDPDLDVLRGDPRFAAMAAAACQRLSGKHSKAAG